jgi:uncharacterized protein (DUF2235 family)
MPKRIVLCFDGTWNRPADENLPDEQQIETNVRRFYESLADNSPDGAKQAKWYDQGVGTHWYDHVLGGLTGAGLDINIMQGYKFLAGNYAEGDEIYILGFSRGAYTARSLVGLIRNCGLIRSNFLDLQLGMAFGIYRTRDDGPDSAAARFFRKMFSRDVRIKFVGVWDTVGALGIPLRLFKDANMAFYQFHDTNLSRIVEHAYHAAAVDEHREHYDVCLWNPPRAPEQTIEQRWFIGAHSDVGGGYPDRRLSDLALGWMQEKAAAHGLGFKPERIPQPSAQNHLAPCRDSWNEFMKGVYAKDHPRYFRAIGQTQFGREAVDDSVKKKIQDDPNYKPQNKGLQ